jgi:hypothetical protein
MNPDSFIFSILKLAGQESFSKFYLKTFLCSFLDISSPLISMG